MKHLIYALVAASTLGLSAGAYACGEHTAAAASSIVVAQQQVPPATQGADSQTAPAGQSK
jgi:hypothetical protein